MFEAMLKAFKVYFSTLSLVVYFSIFAIFSLLLLPLVSSYVNVGSAFIRFSSLYLDVTFVSGLVLFLVGVISLLSMAFFTSAIINIVKFKETLDVVRFSRVFKSFSKYVIRVFSFLVIMSLASVILGVFFDVLSLPVLAQFLILILWVLFLFTPQVIVLEDLGLLEAINDSLVFLKKKPVFGAFYLLSGAVLILFLLGIETFLGQFFVWEHKIVSIIIVALFVVPFLQMLATELYLKRYPLSSL